MISSTLSGQVIGILAAERIVSGRRPRREGPDHRSKRADRLGAASASRAGGHDVVRLTRSAPRGPGEFRWDPAAGEIDPAAFDGVDAIVHLAGETVAGRWTDAKKRRSATAACSARASWRGRRRHDPRPRAFVCASGIGYYGDRGDEPVTEKSAIGEVSSLRSCGIGKPPRTPRGRPASVS